MQIDWYEAPYLLAVQTGYGFSLFFCLLVILKKILERQLIMSIGIKIENKVAS